METMEQASASIVAFAAGILVTIFLPALPDSGSVTVMFLLALASLRYRHFALAGCFALGLCWHIHFGRDLLATEIPESWQQGSLQLEGVVRNLPRRSINVDGSTRLSFELDVERVFSEGRQLRFAGPLIARLSWSDAGPVAANQRWRLTAKLQRPRGLANPGTFDYRAWLLSRGVGATGRVLADNGNIFLGHGNLHLAAVRQWYREQFEQRFSGDPGLALLAALGIGDKQQLSPQQRQVLALTGTSHLMVISGLHIGLCALLGYWLAYMLASLRPRWVQCGRAQQFASAGSLLLATAYAGLAGFSLPTTRALLMVLVVLAARQLGRETSALRILLLALLAVLLHHPLAVIEAGFWLSFGAVAILILPSGRTSRGSSKFLASLRLQLRLLIGMSPMMALLLGQFSLLAPVVNLVAIPLLGLTIVPVLLAAMLLLPLSDGIGGALLELAMQLLRTYWQALSAIAQFSPSWLPGNLFATGPALVLAALAVVLFLLPRGLPGRMAWPLLLLPLLLPDANHRDGLDVYVLDIGQGTSVVVQTREHVLVYDTGPAYSSGYDAGSSILLPFLRHRGIRAIDTLVLSHGDNDHSGGAASILAGMQVRKWMAPAAIPRLGVPPVKCRAGMQWQWDGVRFEVLHPGEELPERSNNQSCVLMISGSKRRYLLAGDIERSVERELVARHGPGLKTDVLLIPHHGSRSSSSYDFSWFTRPAIAVASVGYRNHFGHPAAAVQERYQSRGAVVLSTAETGALHFNEIEDYRAYRWFYTRYWQHYPCSLAGKTKRSWLLGGSGSWSPGLPACETSPAGAVDAAFLW
jgi:competence protein ComEC